MAEYGYNEIIFVITALLDLFFVVFMLRCFGKFGPLAAITVNIILISTFGAKLVEFFGWLTNVGNVFYATVFASAVVLTECFGKKEAYRSVWVGFAGLLLFIIMGQLTVQLTGAAETRVVSEALLGVFREAVLRIALASSAAYILSQHLNIWLFDYLRRKSGRGVGVSTVASAGAGQLLDSLIFFSVAFAGQVPAAFLTEIILVGFVAKVLVAIFSVPFVSWSRRIKEGGMIPNNDFW